MELNESFNVVSFYFDNDKFMEYFYDGIQRANTSSKRSAWTRTISSDDSSMWSIVNDVTFPSILEDPKLPVTFALRRSRSNKISVGVGLMEYNSHREKFYKGEGIDFDFFWSPDTSSSIIKINLCGVYDFKKHFESFVSGRFRIKYDWLSKPSMGNPVLSINTEGLIGYDPYRLHLNCYAIICREILGSISSLFSHNKYTEEFYKNRSSFMERALGVMEREIKLPPL